MRLCGCTGWSGSFPFPFSGAKAYFSNTEWATAAYKPITNQNSNLFCLRSSEETKEFLVMFHGVNIQTS